MPPQPKTLEERFWPKVQKTETCWIWTGRPNPGGYGQINSGGKHGWPLLAHRVSYEWAWDAPIPRSICVLHHCDNRMCVRPDHLFLGTRPDNMADKIAKGRQLRGTDHPLAKLTWEQVAEIKRRYTLGGVSYATLGQEYGVDFGRIGRIVRNEAWQPHPHSPAPSRSSIEIAPPPGT